MEEKRKRRSHVLEYYEKKNAENAEPEGEATEEGTEEAPAEDDAGIFPDFTSELGLDDIEKELFK